MYDEYGLQIVVIEANPFIKIAMWHWSVSSWQNALSTGCLCICVVFTLLEMLTLYLQNSDKIQTS